MYFPSLIIENIFRCNSFGLKFKNSLTTKIIAFFRINNNNTYIIKLKVKLYLRIACCYNEGIYI